jgi:peptide deformylase
MNEKNNMALLKIVKYPDPILKKKCQAVTVFDDALQTLLDDMLMTMYADQGMGLAANQVGVSKRIFIMDENPEEPQPIFFINPEIVLQSDELTEAEEGCLSFPGIRLVIRRPLRVVVKALDREGREFLCEREGYSARCLLHEYDHLDGITFFDHLSALKRQLAEKKLLKYRQTSSM